MRDLVRDGHGKVEIDANKQPAGFPLRTIAARILDVRDNRIKDSERFASLPIEWKPAKQSGWSLIGAYHSGGRTFEAKPLYHLAAQVVRYGPWTLDHLPHARFGKLMTPDRLEIESLRQIRQRLRDYKDTKSVGRPLSIGVFGPPGSGKSFGVQQLTEEIFGEASWFPFNLSQFTSPQDLIGAFHLLRDRALTERTPVAFWDEFDSENMFWLRHLLAPMQDGKFQDGDLNHSIGRCVFIFAGGTSSTFDEFAKPRAGGKGSTEQRTADREFSLKKGPDFASRIDTFINVLGPNQRQLANRYGRPQVDDSDVAFPVRRALLIRHFLKRGEREYIDIDRGLLHALLRTRDYRHGSRSVEKLIEALRGGANGDVRRSSLPPAGQLGMHVDITDFMSLMEQHTRAPTALPKGYEVEKIADKIHTEWRAASLADGLIIHPRYDKEYEYLGPHEQGDNISAARRMPEVLAMIGLEVIKVGGG